MSSYWQREYDEILSEAPDDPDEDYGLVKYRPRGDSFSDSGSEISVGELGDGAKLDLESESEDELEGVDGVEGEEADLGMFARMQRRRSTDNENTWEVRCLCAIAAMIAHAQHMSPTIARLPKSPADRRRSSSGSSLRPIASTMVGSNGQGTEGDDDVFVGDNDEGEMPGPMPIERETQDEQDRSFGAVDEVEYAYGE